MSFASISESEYFEMVGKLGKLKGELDRGETERAKETVADIEDIIRL